MAETWVASYLQPRNIPRSIEYNVEWVTGLIRFMREHNLTRADARPEAVAAWTDHVKSLGEGLLSNEVNSWMTGVNTNVEGKQTRIIARYIGSAPAYRPSESSPRWLGSAAWVERPERGEL